MARDYQRSVRLDNELKRQIDTLPYGSLNSVVNQLLHEFFRDEGLRKRISAKDTRFNNWIPMQLKPMPPLPGQVVIPTFEHDDLPEFPKPSSRVDDLLAGL